MPSAVYCEYAATSPSARPHRPVVSAILRRNNSTVHTGPRIAFTLHGLGYPPAPVSFRYATAAWVLGSTRPGAVSDGLRAAAPHNPIPLIHRFTDLTGSLQLMAGILTFGVPTTGMAIRAVTALLQHCGAAASYI